MGLAQKNRQGLWRYYPSFECLFGADPGLPVVQALWQHMPNPEVAQHRRKSSVATILKAHKIRRFQATQVLAQLRAEPLPVSTTTTMLLQAQITLWFQQLDLVQQQLNAVTQQLESKLESMSTMAAATTTNSSDTDPPHPSDRDILASIPGVGTMVLANLLGEAGTAIRDRDYAALRCLTGVAPRHQTFREILSRPTPPSSKPMACGQCLSLGSRGGTSRSHLSTTIRSTEDTRSYPWSSVTCRRRSPVSRRLRVAENRYTVPTKRRRNLTLTLFRSRYGLATAGFRKKKS